MSYGEILKTAFAITRHNRYLWFFGLFAGGAGGFNFPTNFSPPSDTDNETASDALEAIDPGVIVAVVTVALLLALVFIVLSLIAQGALVESVAAIDRGGQRRFGTAWQAGTRAFWRVLGLVVLLILLVLAILIVVGAPLAGIVIGVFAGTEAPGVRIAVAILVGLLALAAFILLFVPLQIVGALSLRELVLREERPVAALRRGYRMFRAHLGPSILVWLIQLAVGIGVTIVLIVLGIIVGVAIAVPVIALFAAEVVPAAIAVLVIAAIVLIPLLLALFGALGTFTHSVWTLAYLRLGRETPGPPA